MHMEMSPLFASNRNGSRSLLSWTKKWMCNQKESVKIIFVNLVIPLLLRATEMTFEGYLNTTFPGMNLHNRSR